MTKPKLLVTGATGKTGSAVVRQLREKNFPVRALVRKHDARSEKLRQCGAETVIADMFDPQQMLEALRGTQRAYYCPPVHPYMIQSAAAFAYAAREAKIEAVTGLSQWLASPNHPALLTRQHWLVDQMFSMIPNIAFTVVNPGFFADEPYLSVFRYAAHLGMFPMFVKAEGRNAPPSVEDIARVAVATLTDPGKHSGKTYRPTGPELLSITDMTRIISRVLGRKIRHFPMPMWMFYKAARLDGFSPYFVSNIHHYAQEHDNGAFEFAAPNDHVLEVTGVEPETFETIVRRHAALPANQRTVGNIAKTIADFMRVPFMPGLNPGKFAREQFHPSLATLELNMKNESWKAEHLTQASISPSLNALTLEAQL